MSDTTIQRAAIVDIIAERLRQDEKWGVQNHDPLKWLAIETEELGEVAKECLRWHFGGRDLANYRKEMVQVAAVALAAIECLDRGEWPTAPPYVKPEGVQL